MTFEEAIREADREWEERVIPNGKEMNWKGHKLHFESESSKCQGCFFDDKNECPDCDEGVWVEDSPWCTGTPKEEGNYIVHFCGKDVDGESYEYDEVHEYKDLLKYIAIEDSHFKIVAWQKYEPYKETENGHTD